MVSFFDRWRRVTTPPSESQYQQELERLRRSAPVPRVWLFGKTGSGKSSLVRSLTGAHEATIGQGFRPETQFSRRYKFPNEEETLVEFIDTRGLGEAHYDPSADIERFNDATELMIVTVKVTDRALAGIVEPLRQIRRQCPERPVLLVLTCLHEAIAGDDISQGEDPFSNSRSSSSSNSSSSSSSKLDTNAGVVPSSEPRVGIDPRLQAAITSRQEDLKGLFDQVVPVDITRPEDGFADPDFGGQRLRASILELLPAAYRHGLLTLSDPSVQGHSYRQQQARWQILASSGLAASAGAVPIPWMDIPVVIGLQYHMAVKLARIYEQPFHASHWAAISGAASGRVAMQLAMRGALKFIPWVGMVAGAASSFAYTYALGMSIDWYYADLCGGRVPDQQQLQQVFSSQLEQGRRLWMRKQA